MTAFRKFSLLLYMLVFIPILVVGFFLWGVLVFADFIYRIFRDTDWVSILEDNHETD